MRDVRALPVIWQRLVGPDGTTCDRCAATQAEVERAVEVLGQVLHPLGIEPRLEVAELDQAAFKANPDESNRIWVAGKLLEDWIDGRIGSSRCCGVCGDSDCRTVEVGGSIYEKIPEQLIVRAALIAASDLLADG